MDKISNNKKRSEIASNKFRYLLQLLLEYRERLEYKFSNIRAEESYNGKITLINGTKGDLHSISDSNNVKCWTHQIPGDHTIWRCLVFESKTPSEKVQIVRTKNACFACFEIGHIASRCTREFKYKEDGCGLPHHQLLHAHKSGIVFHNYISKNKTEMIFQLQIIYCCRGFGAQYSINIMQYAGSSIPLINFPTAEKLKLSGKMIKREITTVGGNIKTVNCYS